MTYIVETKFVYGWENCWMNDDKPITFETRKEALTYLTEYLADIKQAVIDGDIIEEYPHSDFRITKLNEGN